MWTILSWAFSSFPSIMYRFSFNYAFSSSLPFSFNSQHFGIYYNFNLIGFSQKLLILWFVHPNTFAAAFPSSIDANWRGGDPSPKLWTWTFIHMCKSVLPLWPGTIWSMYDLNKGSLLYVSLWSLLDWWLFCGCQVRRKDLYLLSAASKLIKDIMPRLPHSADGLIFQVLWDLLVSALILTFKFVISLL